MGTAGFSFYDTATVVCDVSLALGMTLAVGAVVRERRVGHPDSITNRAYVAGIGVVAATCTIYPIAEPLSMIGYVVFATCAVGVYGLLGVMLFRLRQSQIRSRPPDGAEKES